MTVRPSTAPRTRRPPLPRVVAAVLAPLVLAATGCAPEAVRVRPPHPAPPVRSACQALLARLPDRVAGQQRRPTAPDAALAAAWGDPPIVLRCGVARPRALRPTSHCTVVDGIGWFAQRSGAGYGFTTVGRAAFVQLTVPAAYAPAADALVDVAGAVRRIPERSPCL